MSRVNYVTRHTHDPFPALIARFPDDMDAQKEMYRQLRILLTRTCSDFLRVLPGETMEDLTHDAISRVLLKMPGFHGSSRFSTWAMTVGRNECLQKLVKVRRRDKLARIVPLSESIARKYRGGVYYPPLSTRRRQECSQGHPIEQHGTKRLCTECRRQRERKAYWAAKART